LKQEFVSLGYRHGFHGGGLCVPAVPVFLGQHIFGFGSPPYLTESTSISYLGWFRDECAFIRKGLAKGRVGASVQQFRVGRLDDEFGSRHGPGLGLLYATRYLSIADSFGACCLLYSFFRLSITARVSASSTDITQPASFRSECVSKNRYPNKQ
jgi:hypothetical protein